LVPPGESLSRGAQELNGARERLASRVGAGRRVPSPRIASTVSLQPRRAAPGLRGRGRGGRRFMLELRLTQHPAKRGRHTVEIALEGDGARRTAASTFAFALSSQDEEAVRWYLEDFLQYPQEPAPTIAERVEGRIAEIGRELFAAVFRSSDDARDLWAQTRKRPPCPRQKDLTPRDRA